MTNLSRRLGVGRSGWVGCPGQGRCRTIRGATKELVTTSSTCSEGMPSRFMATAAWTSIMHVT
jgi:hypothetical protein